MDIPRIDANPGDCSILSYVLRQQEQAENPGTRKAGLPFAIQIKATAPWQSAYFPRGGYFDYQAIFPVMDEYFV